MPLYNLATRRLEDTYPVVTQVSKSSVNPDKWSFADGLGNPVYWFDGTASFAMSSSGGTAVSASHSLTTKAAGIEWDIQLNSASAVDGILGVAELGRGYYNWNAGAWTFGNRITGSDSILVGSWSFHTNKDNYSIGDYSIAHGYKNIAIDSADSVEGYYTATVNDTVTSLNLNFIYDSVGGTLTSLQPGNFISELTPLDLSNTNIGVWFYNSIDDILYPISVTGAPIYDSIADRTYFLISGIFGSDDATGNGFIYYQSFSSTIKGEPLANHAEGDHTIAAGDASHAEGKYTWASAVGSHAEGLNTISSNSGSHAEGRNTRATGDGSHAEGSDTIASGSSAHAEGYATLAQGEFSHAEGFYTIASGSAAHAGGRETMASGYGSRAIGYQTVASGDYSNSEGNNSISFGDYSHAEGSGSTSIGVFSHAEGSGSISQGIGSHAEGYNTITSGSYSHAEGGNTLSIGIKSHAEGSGSISRGLGSHAEGFGAIASGSYSHAEGYNSRARGYGSHAEGEDTEVHNTTDYGHSEGGLTFVRGDYSHAEGYGTSASYSIKVAPVASHAEGYYTKAIGIQATHAEGAYTIADGLYSHAEGSGSVTDVSSIASHAEGIFTIASGSGQLAVGRYNLQGNVDDYFVIGDGTSDVARSNAFGVNDQRMYASNSIFFPDLTDVFKPHILVFDTGSKRVFYYTASGLGGGGGPANITVYSSSVLLTSTVSSFNFTGTGVTATAAGNDVTVDIPGVNIQEGGTTEVIAVRNINFTGGGVSVTPVGSNDVTIDITGIGPGSINYLAYFNATNNVVSNTIRYDSAVNRYYVEGKSVDICDPNYNAGTSPQPNILFGDAVALPDQDASNLYVNNIAPCSEQQVIYGSGQQYNTAGGNIGNGYNRGPYNVVLKHIDLTTTFACYGIKVDYSLIILDPDLFGTQSFNPTGNGVGVYDQSTVGIGVPWAPPVYTETGTIMVTFTGQSTNNKYFTLNTPMASQLPTWQQTNTTNVLNISENYTFTIDPTWPFFASIPTPHDNNRGFQFAYKVENNLALSGTDCYFEWVLSNDIKSADIYISYVTTILKYQPYI